MEKVDSKFRFVHVAARRARQLMSGAQPFVHSPSRKATRIAQEEVLSGLIQYETTAVPAPKEPEEQE